MEETHARGGDSKAVLLLNFHSASSGEASEMIPSEAFQVWSWQHCLLVKYLFFLVCRSGCHWSFHQSMLGFCNNRITNFKTKLCSKQKLVANVLST